MATSIDEIMTTVFGSVMVDKHLAGDYNDGINDGL